jgi:hypothetical protein
MLTVSWCPHHGACCQYGHSGGTQRWLGVGKKSGLGGGYIQHSTTLWRACECGAQFGEQNERALD